MRAIPILLLSWSLACSRPADEADTRASWLRQAMIDDNERIIRRDPALAALGLQKIASSPYNFLRGTAQIFVRDATTPGQPGYLPTAYGGAAAARVRIVGDPHVENLGTYLDARGVLVYDYNDFDASTFGPYWLDVRRLCLSFALVAHLAGDGLDDAQRAAITAAAAEAYAAEIAAMAAGGPPLFVHDDFVAGDVYADLVEKALEDGAVREELAEYTRIEGDRRVMFYGEVEAPVTEGLVEDVVEPVSAEVDALVRTLVARYPATLHDPGAFAPGYFAVKGVSRRLGAGVKSWPLLRFYALVEGPTASLDDDMLLELKETGDGLSFPGLVRVPTRVFADNGERVTLHQRALQETRANDALLGWAVADPLVFRIKERTKYQRGLDHLRILDRVARGQFTADDLIAIAALSGRVLARAHALADTLDGEPGLPVIAAALGDDGPGFVAETTAFVAAYLPQLLADHQTFIGLIADDPLLGARF